MADIVPQQWQLPVLRSSVSDLDGRFPSHPTQAPQTASSTSGSGLPSWADAPLRYEPLSPEALSSALSPKVAAPPSAALGMAGRLAWAVSSVSSTSTSSIQPPGVATSLAAVQAGDRDAEFIELVDRHEDELARVRASLREKTNELRRCGNSIPWWPK